jgi:hypothetical protein
VPSCDLAFEGWNLVREIRQPSSEDLVFHKKIEPARVLNCMTGKPVGRSGLGHRRGAHRRLNLLDFPPSHLHSLSYPYFPLAFWSIVPTPGLDHSKIA